MIKNTPATRVTLLTTLRPSRRTSGKHVKSEFNKTTCEICFEASLPSAIAIEQSVSFNAYRSLTPSPVIAT